LDAAKDLGFEERLAEISIYVEKDNLAVASSNAYFVIRYCLDSFYPLGADVLSEHENAVLDLETAEISRLGAHEQVLLVWL